MSKPIRMTDDMKTKVQAEFTELLGALKMSDGEINFSKTFKFKDATATIWLSDIAYRKTVALVNTFKDEVAWHGIVSRKVDNEFVIEDIFVYPQEVSGSTVSTDQERYTTWLYEFDDELFGKIRMQGHSHVNMGVSPSSVDSTHREKILAQLEQDMFYIFMIWNKSMDTHALIYDMENNILYEDRDIAVKIVDDGSFDDFLEDAHEKVQKIKQRYKRSKKDPYENTNSVWNYPFGNGCIDYYGL